MPKVSQRQVLASVVPVEPNKHPKWTGFYFAQVSGGEITASVEKIYEGGKLRPTVLCAPSEVGDITLTAHYDDDRNAADGPTGIAEKIATLRPLVGRAEYDITVETFDCDLKVPGTDRVYAKALLVGITEPDGDSSSGAPATFSLTFAISDVESGAGAAG
jgi:hypothetical protein